MHVWFNGQKPRQAGIVEVYFVRDFKGEILIIFSMNVGVKESIKAEMLAILEALWLFSLSFWAKLTVESDSQLDVVASRFDYY